MVAGALTPWQAHDAMLQEYGKHDPAQCCYECCNYQHKYHSRVSPYICRCYDTQTTWPGRAPACNLSNRPFRDLQLGGTLEAPLAEILAARKIEKLNKYLTKRTTELNKEKQKSLWQ